MPPVRLFTYSASGLVFLSVLICPASGANKPARDPNALPEGLSASDWASIRAAHEAQRLAITANGEGYQAFNPGQQWQTSFDGRGFLTRSEKGGWSWGLELRSYGFKGHEQTLGPGAQSRAEGSCVFYAREDNLREWTVNDQRGLEHGFTVTKRPEGLTTATLEFALSVRGNLRPVVASDQVRFVDQKRDDCG